MLNTDDWFRFVKIEDNIYRAITVRDKIHISKILTKHGLEYGRVYMAESQYYLESAVVTSEFIKAYKPIKRPYKKKK